MSKLICKKLNKEVPKSCHVLNGRKESCESLVFIEDGEIESIEVKFNI